MVGTACRFQSSFLGEERVLNVYLPAGYEREPATSYPVIYVLHGAVHEDYHHVSGLVQFMTAY